MKNHVKDFFQASSGGSSSGHFYRVFPLHEAPDIDCDTLCQMVPDLSKPWYELAVLDRKDRIDFTRDYWLDKLPYHKSFTEFINRFFSHLEDIGIYITQKKMDESFEACMVYSFKGGTSFYRGGSPMTDEQRLYLQKLFPNYILPADYLAFMEIHNGFWKTTDCTGITRTNKIKETYQSLQKMLSDMNLTTSEGKEVDPKTLIPFYESFGLPFFQCFWAEWYPGEEMGNVYIGANTNIVTLAEGGAPSPDNMAFPSFLDWLVFYLEKFA